MTSILHLGVVCEAISCCFHLQTQLVSLKSCPYSFLQNQSIQVVPWLRYSGSLLVSQAVLLSIFLSCSLVTASIRRCKDTKYSINNKIFPHVFIKSNSGTIHNATAIVGVDGKQKKPLLGKAEAATHYLNSTDSIALHNTITAWCAKVRCCMIFSHKKAAYASRTSSPKVKHLIHLVNKCTAKLLKISRRRDKVAHFSHAGCRHFGCHLDV